jgi:hypothetical protein
MLLVQTWGLRDLGRDLSLSRRVDRILSVAMANASQEQFILHLLCQRGHRKPFIQATGTRQLTCIIASEVFCTMRHKQGHAKKSG